MRRFIFLFAALMIFSSCQTEEIKSKYTISGQIQLEGSDALSPIYGVLFSFPSSEKMNSMILDDDAFTFGVEPGNYTLVINTWGYETYQANLLVSTETPSTDLRIFLPRKGIQEDIQRVRLIGDYCSFDINRAVDLQKKGDIWGLEKNVILSPGEKYAFVINNADDDVYDMANRYFTIEQDGTLIYSIYKTGEVVFNPSLYREPAKSATANTEKQTIYDQSNRLPAILFAWDEAVNKFYAEPDQFTQSKMQNTYLQLNQRLDSLQQSFDPIFKPVFIEKRLALLNQLHPLFFELQNYWTNALPDTTALRTLFKSESGKDYFSKNMSILSQIDPAVYYLEGEFQDTYALMRQFLAFFPDLAKRYHFDDESYFEFITNFVRQTEKRSICPGLLFQAATELAANGKEDNALFYIDWILKDFPESDVVKDGSVENLYTSLKISVGATAPGFALKSINGDSLILSRLTGKFVYLDFWGSWCPPCRDELPNLRRLYSETSRDELIIIGMASDHPVELIRFLQEEPLPYPNVLIGNDMIRRYGINRYPTSFLIAPDGQIIAKDLHGKSLITMVKDKMKTYKNINVQ